MTQKIYKKSILWIFLLILLPLVIMGQPPISEDQNYIKSTIVLIPGVQSESQLDNANWDEQIVEQTFYDGLGRPMQNVKKRNSPEGNDVVTPIVYDDYGREYRSYLPVVVNETNGWYKDGILDNNGDYTGIAAEFYNSSSSPVATDSNPYTENFFEPSPLNRPEKVYGPGNDWRSEEKFTSYEYLVNVNGTGSGAEEIIAWDLANNDPERATELTGYIEAGGYYATGQLQVNVIYDEGGKAVREYTNKQGQTILKKVQLDELNPVLNNREHWSQTYYIYDDFGNLCYVFPPELSYKLLQNDTYTPTPDDLKDWAFCYQYDYRNRMTAKRVPGTDWVFMVYDTRDRLILTQDGNQRKHDQQHVNLNNEWIFTKYDVLNRPIATGVYVDNSNLDQGDMETYVNSRIGDEYEWFEELNGPVHGYSDQAFPTDVSQEDYLTITYYDNYGFKNLADFNSTTYDYDKDQLISAVYDQGTYNFNEEEFQYVKGHVTGSQTKVLDGTNSKWLKTVTYFDEKYRVIQTVMDNYEEGIDRVSNIYNFPGWLLETYTSHTTSSSSAIGIKKRYVYDHTGRLLKGYHQIKDDGTWKDEVLLAENHYNELGELIEKNLHVENGVPLQSVDYRYNIRGWLKSINNSSLTQVPEDPAPDYFGMELFYNGMLGN